MKLIKPDEATKLAFNKRGFNGDKIEYTCNEWRIYKSEVCYLGLRNLNVVKSDDVYWTASRERSRRQDGYIQKTSLGSASLEKLHQQIIDDAIAEPEKIVKYLERQKILKAEIRKRKKIRK